MWGLRYASRVDLAAAVRRPSTDPDSDSGCGIDSLVVCLYDLKGCLERMERPAHSMSVPLASCSQGRRRQLLPEESRGVSRFSTTTKELGSKRHQTSMT